MRSYALAIAISMLLSAIYVFQNNDDVTVWFFMFNNVFPQGVWEVLLFSAGIVMMWVFSLFASLELRSKQRAKIKERDKKISALEEEKNALLTAFKHMTPAEDITFPVAPLQEVSPEPVIVGTPQPAATEEKGTV